MVNIKDDHFHDFDATHDALDDDMDINNLSDVEESALAHDACVDHDIDNSDRRDAVESKRMVQLNLNNAFKTKMIFLHL